MKIPRETKRIFNLLLIKVWINGSGFGSEEPVGDILIQKMIKDSIHIAYRINFFNHRLVIVIIAQQYIELWSPFHPTFSSIGFGNFYTYWPQALENSQSNELYEMFKQTSSICGIENGGYSR